MTILYIIGAGGFGFETALICDAMLASKSAPFNSYAFLDDDPVYLNKRGQQKLFGGALSSHEVDPKALYICAIGDPNSRKSIVRTLQGKHAHFTNVIHPTAIVAGSAEIGEGVVICAFAFISTFTKIGNHVHINVSSSIGHDSVLSDFCSLSAHVDITGNVSVEERVFFGTGAAVLPGFKIAADCRIGANVHVMRNLKPECIMYIEPAKFLNKKN
ncbi:acetyltransferase [Parasphingorhabdus flavimaris]|uniref:acetyltransferase n=1 Tax=Parasphingorhabdus flavimaris TaxID=266812 RepID=UPI00300215BA